MDTNEKWITALGLLFLACKPITYDCILTKEEVKEQEDDISRHTFYCLHVKKAIEDGVEPLSWDEWSSKEASFVISVKAEAINDSGHYSKLDKISSREFEDDLTNAFRVGDTK